jgi:hypothetical protein
MIGLCDAKESFRAVMVEFESNERNALMMRSH